MKFRLLDTGFNNAFMNMAIDEALLSSKEPVLRFYQWKPAGLSLGYFQSINDINVEFCKRNKIDIVRRLTGGNAVLHDNELTYAFIVDEPKSSVVESYKEISKGILKALELLGLKAEMNEVVKKEKSAICFNDPSYYEILVNKKKIVGSAQKRVDGKLLQHGALLIGMDNEKYANCFKDADIEKINKRVTSINNELGSFISYDIVKKAMIKGFEEYGLKESELTESEKKLAEELEKKYSSKEWNLK
jgi:lipoate-protein ligase A